MFCCFKFKRNFNLETAYLKAYKKFMQYLRASQNLECVQKSCQFEFEKCPFKVIQKLYLLNVNSVKAHRIQMELVNITNTETKQRMTKLDREKSKR